MNKVNFIPEEEMLQNTYLYENRMFTNKVNQNITLGWQTKG